MIEAGCKSLGRLLGVGLLSAFCAGTLGCSKKPGGATPEGSTLGPTRHGDDAVPVGDGLVVAVEESNEAAKEAQRSPGTVSAGPSTKPLLPPPLKSASELAALEVSGHASAIVWLPVGTTSKRPLIVATHGNYDTPESTCSVWGRIVGSRGFVLCLRGVARSDSPAPDDLVYHYLSTAKLKAEIESALAALKESYGDYVDLDTMIYSGFSQGAIMGVHILLEQAERYPRAVLIEGGFKQWNHYTSRRYAKGGGRRILFACGQWGCKSSSDKSAKRLEKAGIAAKVVGATRSGHTYGGEVARGIASAFDWLVEDDARWSRSLPAGSDSASP